MNALRAGGDRYSVQLHALEDLADRLGYLDALRQPGLGAGVEVDDHAIRVARRAVVAEAPLRHMDLQGGQLREPGQHRRVVGQRIDVRALLVDDLTGRHPAGGAVLDVLAEEDLSGLVRGADPVHPPLAGGRPPGRLRYQHRGDLEVVVDDLALGGARLRVHDLVEVGHGERHFADLDGLGLLGCHQSSSSGGGCLCPRKSCVHPSHQQVVSRLAGRHGHTRWPRGVSGVGPRSGHALPAAPAAGLVSPAADDCA